MPDEPAADSEEDEPVDSEADFDFNTESSDCSTSGPELWSDSDDSEQNDDRDEQNKREFSLVQVATLFLLLWQSVFKVSNTALNTLLRFFSLLISQIASIPELENRKVISDIFP
ncbi:hypothetical protein GBAR_LOCUS26501, partial [Geodia barretti]